MSYEPIDLLITAWAGRHGLHVYNSYRGEEVRSVDLAGMAGRRCEIWVDPPDANGHVGVHVWDYRKRRQDDEVTISELPRCLEQAHATATGWLGSTA